MFCWLLCKYVYILWPQAFKMCDAYSATAVCFFPSLAHYSTQRDTGLWCWVDWFQVRCYHHREMTKEVPGLSFMPYHSSCRHEIPETFTAFLMSQQTCEVHHLMFFPSLLNHSCTFMCHVCGQLGAFSSSLQHLSQGKPVWLTGHWNQITNYCTIKVKWLKVI